MATRFYRQHAWRLLLAVLVSFPVLYYEAESIPCNNNIEAWLPDDSAVRVAYEQFKAEFGAEEFILIGLSDRSLDDPLIESLAGRLEQLPEIRRCWTPARLKHLMRSQLVPDADIDRAISGLVISADGTLQGILAILSPKGVSDRAGAVAAVQRELDYCRLTKDDVLLAGVPVVVAELDRLGGIRENEKFFVVTLLLSAGLLFWFVREWKLSLGILGVTIWAIELTQTVIKWTGGEVNFILSALPPMVMVFTLSTAIHVLHYYQMELQAASSSGRAVDPLWRSLRGALRPCVLSTLTTVIGLLALKVGDIQPVNQFCVAASIGSVVALVAGLGLTPALLIVCPLPAHRSARATWGSTSRAGLWIVSHGRLVASTGLLLILGAGAGLLWLDSHIDPLDFLPRDSRVLRDTLEVDSRLTNVESIEAIVDFGTSEASFVHKLERVREIEAQLSAHPQVRHTLSLARFFPREFPDSALETARLLGDAASQPGSDEYLSLGQRFWRITVRLHPLSMAQKYAAFEELRQLVERDHVTLTGSMPLLSQAQLEIFDGFWRSFAAALAVITVVMIAALRSVPMALLAMIPNVGPIAIVFGLLGWFGEPVDIGTMMTASIALGIAVDGTLHQMVTYQRRLRHRADPVRAAAWALLRTGSPILGAAIITSVGMSALAVSPFAPTARFGILMAVLTIVAAFGDLCLLPALLSWGARKHAPGRERLYALSARRATRPAYRKTA